MSTLTFALRVVVAASGGAPNNNVVASASCFGTDAPTLPRRVAMIRLRAEPSGASFRAMSAPDAVRAAGSRCKQPAMTAATAAGQEAMWSSARGIGSIETAWTVSARVMPRNGRRPERSSKSVTPSDHTSARALTWRELGDLLWRGVVR